MFSTPLSLENMVYNWKLWHTEFNNLQPKAFVWCRVGWNGSILDIFHANTTRQIFSQSSIKQEGIKQERPQSQNRLRKAQKAWHVKDPWVAGALRAPQSLFARLTHSIFEALPPFARSIPASQTVGFTTRCHQRPWLGWQIELATRAHSHTRKHTHTILSWTLKQWCRWAHVTCFTEINKKSTDSFTETQDGKEFLSVQADGKWACQVECFTNLGIYRTHLSVKVHTGKKKRSRNLRPSVTINTSQSD